MIPLDFSIFLKLFRVVIDPLSILSLGLILSLWRQRSRQGFRFGDTVDASPWTTRDVIQTILLLLLIQCQIVLIGGTLNKAKIIESVNRHSLFTIIAQLIVYGSLLVLVGKLINYYGLTWKKAFGFSRGTLIYTIAAALVALIAIEIPVIISSVLSQYIAEKLKFSLEPQSIFDQLTHLKNPFLKSGMILIAVVGAPVTEEILFRGVIYSWLKKNWGFTMALVMNSLIFAFVHLHLPSFLPLFLLAIGFTLLYEWTGNLLANILMHAGFNGVSLFLFWVKTNSTTSG
jgi:membrane protease YdiL (CAAX protease family)